MLNETNGSKTVLADTASEKTLYINEDMLPAYQIKGALNGANFTPATSEDVTGNKNIHVGGLVLVKGVYYTINTLNSSTGAVSLKRKNSSGTYEPANFLSALNQTVEFIYANVVDHVGTSEANMHNLEEHAFDENNNLNVIAGTDDGDNMMEYLEANGSSYNWYAKINSKNIADGNIEIHVVAFDRAGNISHGYVQTSVQNNRPRLAKVRLATDLNGNGKFDYAEASSGNVHGEFYEYSALDSEGKTSYIASIASSDFTAKDKLLILPEFVNDSGNVAGNNTIEYIMNVADNSDGNAADITTATKKRAATETEAAITTTPLTAKTTIQGYCSGTNVANIISEKGGMYFENDLAEGKNKLQISFWDNTDGLTVGVDSQWAVLNVPLTIDFVDDANPTGYVAPFFWHDKTHNSLYGNSSANGHIELYGDLPEALKASPYSDAEKVSGKIMLRGYAEDNRRLKTLTFKMDGKVVGTASYAKGTNSWSYTPAADNGGIADSIAVYDALPSGMELSDFDSSENASAPYFNMDGHKVFFQVGIDTSKVSGVAALGKNLTVEVTDEANKASGAVDKLVDIVPYVTSIERNSTYNTNRARSGAIPLLRGETLNKITGFNIANITNSSLKVTPDNAGTDTAVSMESLAVSGNDLTFTVPDTAKSGYLQLVINKVPALNNMNAYREYNEEQNAKAYDHNTLTDDRYVLIWRVTSNDTFKGSTNPIYPAMTKNSSGVLYASFSDYTNSRVNYSTLKATEATRVFFAFDPPEETDICIGTDNSGKDQINIVYAANYQGGNGDSDWVSGLGKAGGMYIYDDSAPQMSVKSGNDRIYRMELYYHNKMLQQFKNMRIARGKKDNYIHVVYYDRITNAIKYADVLDGSTFKDSTNFELPWVKIDGGEDSDDTAERQYSYKTGFRNPQTHVVSLGNSVVLTESNFESGVEERTDENGAKKKVTNGTGESAYIALNSNNYPVIVYMDANTSTLRLARANANSPMAAINWKVQNVLSNSDANYSLASDYISIAIDSSDYLHIAFQNTRGQLVYVKSTNNPKDGSAYTFGSSEVLDDSGMWIDMTMDGTTPYISYLSRVNSYDGMKIAFKDSSFDEDNDGAADTNGGWEIMTAPLNAKVTNVRSCIEVNAKAQDDNTYKAAIGFCPGADYRAAFFTGK